MSRRVAAGCIAAALLLALASGCRKKPPSPVELAMTPEVAQTGLVQMLTATFQRQSNVSMHLRIATEQEIERAARAHALQVVITADSNAQAQFADLARLSGHFASREFAIFGPKRDPARIHDSQTVDEALRRIAKRKARFCSAVDVGEVQRQEEAFWSAAKIDPLHLRRHSQCHGDAIEALRDADGKNAYTLTYAQISAATGTRLDIKPLLESRPGLHDDYTVVLIDHQPRTRQDKDAEWFVQWLMSYQGRDAVQNYRADGAQPFAVRDRQGTR